MRRDLLLWGFVVVVGACATPAPPPERREVEFRAGATLAEAAPQSTDLQVDKASANVKSGDIEMSSPLSGGFVIRIHIKVPNPGMSYEMEAGNARGECEVQGKLAPLEGYVRLDEWTKADNIASVTTDVWCKPEGFEQPRRVRTAFTQKHPGQTTIGDDVRPY